MADVIDGRAAVSKDSEIYGLAMTLIAKCGKEMSEVKKAAGMDNGASTVEALGMATKLITSAAEDCDAYFEEQS